MIGITGIDHPAYPTLSYDAPMDRVIGHAYLKTMKLARGKYLATTLEAGSATNQLAWGAAILVIPRPQAKGFSASRRCFASDGSLYQVVKDVYSTSYSR